MAFQSPKGTYDILPGSPFLAVRDGLLAPSVRAGYAYVEAPVFEDTELFTRGVGASTDVVTKEMFTFPERGLTLRPEGTAGVVRAVVEHGLQRGQLPVKLRYAGPMFRAERPQAGRFRQFQQVGIEALGVTTPPADRRTGRSWGRSWLVSTSTTRPARGPPSIRCGCSMTSGPRCRRCSSTRP